MVIDLTDIAESKEQISNNDKMSSKERIQKVLRNTKGVKKLNIQETGGILPRVNLKYDKISLLRERTQNQICHLQKMQREIGALSRRRYDM